MAMSLWDDYSKAMDTIEEQQHHEPELWREIRSEEIGTGTPARPGHHQIRQWALVLDARNIPCLFDVHDGRWRLMVPPERYDAALRELSTYHRANRNWPPPSVTGHPMVENTLATMSVLILLAIFHNITLLQLPGAPEWNLLGAADAAAIRDGEWWRLVTALTLHADWGHLAGNLAIGGVFTVILCRDLGSGLAWCLLLSAGTLGNLCNALLHNGSHNSVGASTAVFGVVGILAAVSLLRYRGQLQRRWPLPIAAAVALLALLGTEGKNTDLGAHLFGFVAGILLGLATEYLVERHGRPGNIVNLLLVFLGGATVAGAWWAAVLAG